jgi:ABC-type bacteriocin/lantibiotic exporter with double-glycine peptidase domain
MRAKDPEVNLLLLDEPVRSYSYYYLLIHCSPTDIILFEQTSSLDGQAQSRIFDKISDLSHPPNNEESKTVIFITHRLPLARRADKIAMMENGVSPKYALLCS